MSQTITEARRAGGFLVSQANGTRSVEQGPVANPTGAAVSYPAGLVMAVRAVGAVTGAKLSGAGNGTVTVANPAFGARALIGTYVLTALSATAFAVVAPDGTRLADLTVGTAYAGPHIALTIAAGGTPWAAGDVVQVVVPAGDGALLPFTNAAHLPARAVLFASVTVAATATARGVSVRRACEVNWAELAWDPSLSGGALTAAQAAARLSLDAAGIHAR